MTLPSTVSNCVNSKPDIAIGVLSQGPRRALSVEETASARGGRGVLDGVFAVLDALRRRWQPDPLLRQAGQAPMHDLAMQVTRDSVVADPFMATP